MSVCGKIASGFSYDCLSTITGGAEQKFVIVNRVDIDRIATTIDVSGGNHKISHFQLKSGTTGFLIAGQTDKKHIGFTSTFNRSEEARNDHTHGANFKVYDKSESTLDFLSQLSKGADVVIIAQMKDIGVAGETKYMIYGFHNGLKLTELKMTTLEGKGTTPLVLSSVDDLEPTVPYVYFDTDIATTDAQFDALFAQP